MDRSIKLPRMHLHGNENAIWTATSKVVNSESTHIAHPLSTGSWYVIDEMAAVSSKPATPVSIIDFPVDESKMVNIYVGLGEELELLTIHEELFHAYISGFDEEGQRTAFEGVEKKLVVPGMDPKPMAALIKWIYGEKEEDVFPGHPVDDIDTPLHDLLCFKLYGLADFLQLEGLIRDCLRKIEEYLDGGAWSVTAEAVALVYSDEARHETLRDVLTVGSMREWFAGGPIGDGSSWKNTMLSNEAFAKAVYVLMGHHLTIDLGDCALAKCYSHFPQIRTPRKVLEKAASV